MRLRLGPARLDVAAGEIATTVTLRNISTRVESCRLAAHEPAGAFVSVKPPVLRVFPGDEAQAPPRFGPARAAQPPAGTAEVEVVVRSEVHDGLVDVACGSVTVEPFDHVTATLDPRLIRGRMTGSHSVLVGNKVRRRTRS